MADPVMTVALNGQEALSTLNLRRQTTDPPPLVSGGKVYCKFVGPNNELFWEDEVGNVEQITGAAGGPVLGAGVPGQVTFWTAVNTVSSDAGFLWDNTLKQLKLFALPTGTSFVVDGATAIHTDAGPIVSLTASFDTTAAATDVVAHNLTVRRAPADTGRTRGFNVELEVTGAYDTSTFPDPGFAAYRAHIGPSFIKTAGAGIESVGFSAFFEPAQDLEGPNLASLCFVSTNLTAAITGITEGIFIDLNHTNVGFAVGEMDGVEVNIRSAVGTTNTGGARYLILSDAGAGLNGTITGDIYIIRERFQSGTASITGNWLGNWADFNLSAMTVSGSAFGFNQTYTGGSGIPTLTGFFMDLNGAIPGANTYRGFHLDIDGVVPAAGTTVVGFDIVATGIAVTAGSIFGARISMPGAFGAATEIGVRVTGDARTVDIITDSFAVDIIGNSRMQSAWYFTEGSDPGALADNVAIYSKDVAGTTYSFAQDSAGTVRPFAAPTVTTLDTAGLTIGAVDTIVSTATLVTVGTVLIVWSAAYKTGGADSVTVKLFRDGVEVNAADRYDVDFDGATVPHPSTAFHWVDTPSAASHTYTVRIISNAGGGITDINVRRLTVEHT